MELLIGFVIGCVVAVVALFLIARNNRATAEKIIGDEFIGEVIQGIEDDLREEYGDLIEKARKLVKSLENGTETKEKKE